MTDRHAATGCSLTALAKSILRAARIDGPFTATPLTGGRNNRTVRLTTCAGDFFLKHYADNRSDPRDRVGAESVFCRYAESVGIGNVPRVIAVDPATRTTLFSFIPGNAIACDGANGNAVSQAIDFIVALNRRRENGLHLPDASEANFSFFGHYASIRSRLENLRTNISHREAAAFLHHEIWSLWQDIEASSRMARDDRGLCECAPGERCISPSDFGFHNALATVDGQIHFVDFEYAGWDDPARMICDFFLQVAVPVPLCFLPVMVRSLAPWLCSEERLRRRVAALMPLYHLKWCCLLLNDFHPRARARRKFAGLRLDGEHFDRQLQRARARLADRSAIDAARKLAEERP